MRMNSSSLKTRLAIGFLKAMKKRLASASTADKDAIRGAAYASMASTIGPRRAWSRAILRNIKNRNLKTPRHHHHHRGGYRKRVTRGNPRNDGIGEELRQLVPGGAAMDSWNLLNETAHYIKCLKAQLQIMTNILHSSST